jgi:hypothetical protein
LVKKTYKNILEKPEKERFGASAPPLFNSENHSSLSCFYEKLFEKHPPAFFLRWAIDIIYLMK